MPTLLRDKTYHKSSCKSNNYNNSPWWTVVTQYAVTQKTADKLSYVSTGGGAMLEYLEGKNFQALQLFVNSLNYDSVLYISWNVIEIFLLGCISIRWYSPFVLGFVLGWYIFRWFFRTEKIKETLLDPLLYTLIAGTIIGARLGHCIFYQPEYYFGSWKGFWEIFMPWKGGLASHGGTIALLLAMWWFAKKYGPRYRFDFLWLLDRLLFSNFAAFSFA